MKINQNIHQTKTGQIKRNPNKALLFDVNTAPQVINKLQNELDVAEFSGQYSTLGGDEQVTILFTISLDNKSEWENGYIQNSRYGHFRLERYGRVEMFSGSLRPYMRKFKAKDLNTVIKKLNKYFDDRRMDN